MSMQLSSGAPFNQTPEPPRSISSHTGVSKKGIFKKLFANLSSAFIVSEPDQPSSKQAPLRDVKKPDQMMMMRGVIKQPVTKQPSNLMAGQPAPKPLSATPPVPGGNKPQGPPMISGGGGSMISGVAKPPGVVGPAKPPGVVGPAKPPGVVGPTVVAKPPGVAGPTVVAKPPGVVGPTVVAKPPGVVGPTVVAPARVLAGTLNMVIPVGRQGKPLLSKIKNINFIPSATNVSGVTPVFNFGIKKEVLPPPPIAPPIVFKGNKVRTYQDGRKVIIRRGKTITIYPNGERVVMKRGSLGRMTVTKTRRLPDGTRVAVIRKPGGRVTTVTMAPTGEKTVRYQHKNGRVKTVIVSPTGQKTVSIRRPNGTVRTVITTPTGQKVVTIQKRNGQVRVIRRR